MNITNFPFLFMISSQEQVDQPDYQKEKIECADFSALEWKLTGVQVNPKIVRILKELNWLKWLGPHCQSLQHGPCI